MKRTACYNCVRKHLAQARILYAEMFQGYPEHAEISLDHLERAEQYVTYWTCMGHMAEASDEIVAADYGFASRIRHARLDMQEDPNARPDFEGLILEAAELELRYMEKDVLEGQKGS